MLLTGVCSGLALLSKFTAVLLPPVLVAVLIVSFFSKEYKSGKFRWTRYAGGTLAALVIALLVLNAGYGFDKTLLPLSASDWDSNIFKTIKNSFFGKIPIPLPYLYLDAFDIQLRNKSQTLFVYFLNGELSRRGWASYYWFALLYKTPVPLLIACCAAFFAAFRRNASLCERALWIAPAAFMFTFTFFARIDMGFRYLLPIVPFMVVLAAGTMARAAEKKRIPAAVVVILCLWYGSSIFRTFGNGMAYFNEFAGGPAGGHRHLIESNLDWGQNLIRLEKFIGEKQYTGPLFVYNYSLVPPQAYGMESFDVPCEPVRGLVAISVNFLQGVDPLRHRGKTCFRWLSQRKPTATLGHGLYVYDTNDDSSIPY